MSLFHLFFHIRRRCCCCFSPILFLSATKSTMLFEELPRNVVRYKYFPSVKKDDCCASNVFFFSLPFFPNAFLFIRYPAALPSFIACYYCICSLIVTAADVVVAATAAASVCIVVDVVPTSSSSFPSFSSFFLLPPHFQIHLLFYLCF